MSYKFYEKNYPKMIQDPWEDIVDMPAATWRKWGLSPNNYMVKSNHDMFELLHNMGHLSDNMYNKKGTGWVIMNKTTVNQLIKQFEEAMDKFKYISL